MFLCAYEIAGIAPQTRTAPYFTDGAALRTAYGGPPTVILGPGEPAMAHQTDEYCMAPRLTEAVALYKRLIEDWIETPHYTTEMVLAELEKREPGSRDYIRPQRDHADIVVRFYSPGDAMTNGDDTPELNVSLVLRPTIPHPDLTYLVEEAHRPDRGIRLELGRDGGRAADFLKIAGNVAAPHAAELEQAIWQHLPGVRPLESDQFGAYQDRASTRHSNQLALTQLLLSSHLLRKYSDIAEMPFASPVATLSRTGAIA